jgi:hydroxyethylthiazole kinase-like uncharacterized protein yjeF
MKILSSSQIREADRQTILRELVSSVELMERAATACLEWITQRYDAQQKFTFLVGTGNNGGDGLALCRMLREKNYSCTLLEFPLGANPSEDYHKNKAKIDLKSIKKLTQESLTASNQKDIFIDALVGTGLNRPVTGALRKIIKTLNRLPNTVIAIDIPSGLFPDFNTDNPAEGIVQARHTLSFQMPKLAFLLPERGSKVGQFHLLDIGLLPAYIEKVKTPYRYLTKKYAKSFFKNAQKFDHKGTNGQLLLIAGSQGKMGAAVLAAKAALRSGVGKLSVVSPRCGVEILQTAISEAMVEINDGNCYISGYYGFNFNTIAIGPGMGTAPETKDYLQSIFATSQTQLVIDADAINLLAMHSELLQLLPQNTILTPHPKEFERLAGHWKNESEKLELLTRFAQQNQIICLLKGAHTVIALPDGTLYFNSSGNPAMATAGSGDVLTGIIGALLAKGYSPEKAALLGVFAHGQAGDIKTQTLATPYVIASDIIDGLNPVWKSLQSLD